MNPNWSQLQPYLQQYGQGVLSYSTLQAGMKYYIEPGVGYIAYMPFRHWLLAPFGRNIVLADPICADEQATALLERFINQHGRVIVLQCSSRIGKIMETLGYEVNQFGTEIDLPMPFRLEGKDRAKLRQWRNKCERERVVVTEQPLGECERMELDALSSEWMKGKGGHQLILLTRPLVFENEPGVRCFWARQNGKLMGMATFDPMYSKGKVIGYYHNADRIAKEAPNGVSVFIILEAMKVFEAEGVKLLSLGLAPLYRLRPDFRQNRFTMEALKFAFRKLNFLYPFKGSVSHKKKFHGARRSVYFSSTQGNRLLEMFILMKAMKMI